MENVAIYLLLWWVFCGGIGAAVGQLKEKAIQGMLLGALLGPIGIIIAAIVLQKDQHYPPYGGSYYDNQYQHDRRYNRDSKQNQPQFKKRRKLFLSREEYEDEEYEDEEYEDEEYEDEDDLRTQPKKKIKKPIIAKRKVPIRFRRR